MVTHLMGSARIRAMSILVQIPYPIENLSYETTFTILISNLFSRHDGHFVVVLNR
jgi:hypothetical protein